VDQVELRFCDLPQDMAGRRSVDVGGRIALAAQDTKPLLFTSQTRADARALIGAVFVGLLTGAALGGFYLAGGMAKAADQHSRFSRLAGAAGGAYTEAAFTNATNDNAALAVAARLNTGGPVANTAGANRQLELLDARLQRRLNVQGQAAPQGLLLRANLKAYNPSPGPFRFQGALEGSRELDCLTQAVYYEARGETPSGQAAVAQVVLNRARSPAFPSSVCGVVFQRAGAKKGCQFSFACDGSTQRAREPGAWRRAQTIASRALDGFVMAEVGSATHFHTLNVAPLWGPRLMRVAQVGMHVFYRFGGRAGTPAAFTSDVEFASNEEAAISDVAATFRAATAVLPVAAALVEGGKGGPTSTPSEPASAPPAPIVAATPPHAPEKAEAKVAMNGTANTL
jgi:spore germination cell wall hydrolase CwlJ-like protein